MTPQGFFVWRPSEAQGPAIFPVQFFVNDNGSPSLEAHESITINVHEVNSPPFFADLRTRLFHRLPFRFRVCFCQLGDHHLDAFAVRHAQKPLGMGS